MSSVPTCALLCSLVFFISTSAQAQDRGIVGDHLDMYTRQYSGTYNNGSIANIGVVYFVHVDFHAVQQGGYVGGVDTRTCIFEPNVRQLFRGITSTINGSKTYKEDLIAALPPPQQVSYSDNCNNHLPQDAISQAHMQAGSFEMWAYLINPDIKSFVSDLNSQGNFSDVSP